MNRVMRAVLRRTLCRIGIHFVDTAYAPWPWQERCIMCDRRPR